MTPDERFNAKVLRVGECLVWQGGLMGRGYGVFWDGSKPRNAHRYSYERSVGPIPDGLQVDHLCRNKRCVNPAHLEAVTQSVNMTRAKSVITHCRQGHPYDRENTYIRPSGGRDCRKCRTAAVARIRQAARR